LKHKDIYLVLEQIIARTIPLWNQTLTALKSGIASGGVRINYPDAVYDPDPENGPDEDGPQQEDGEDENDYYERRERWIKDTRRVVRPEPDDFHWPPFQFSEHFYDSGTKELKPELTVDIFRDYKSRGLQIIIKLANIHLTPEKPGFAGGAWHVEGQLVSYI
jgi:hypothetical protein